MFYILLKENPQLKTFLVKLKKELLLELIQKTKEVVGFTILNFLKRQIKSPIKLPLSAEFEMVK